MLSRNGKYLSKDLGFTRKFGKIFSYQKTPDYFFRQISDPLSFYEFFPRDRVFFLPENSEPEITVYKFSPDESRNRLLYFSDKSRIR